MLMTIFYFWSADLFQELVAVLVLVQDHFCRWTKRFHLKQNLILIESNFRKYIVLLVSPYSLWGFVVLPYSQWTEG